MGELRRIGDLDIEFDLERERTEWRVQRFGWVVMLMIAIAALAGLLGPGPLSNARAGNGQLQVEYERVARYHAPGSLRIRCGHSEGEDLRISISRSFVENVEIKEISPAPKEQILGGDHYEYVFAKTNEADQLITVRYESTQVGRSQWAIALNDSSPVLIGQFFWP